MYRKFRSISVNSLLCVSLASPFLISGTDKESATETPKIILYNKPATVLNRVANNNKAIMKEAAIYDSMKLRRYGLSRKAFNYAWKGYAYLKASGQMMNSNILSICDFSQSSRRKRLYIIDVASKKLLVNTYVAHGRNSGGEYANSFSNSPESHKSSLGFYITRNTYYGGHGLALKIDGVEKGINDNANSRNIVVHGSAYLGDNFIRHNPFNGRSFGCPAVPAKHTPKVINSIKNGSCLFIYHPTKHYLTKSRILNG